MSMSKKIILFGSYGKNKTKQSLIFSCTFIYRVNNMGWVSVHELEVKNPSSTLSLFVSLPFDSSSWENKIIKRE